MDPSETLRTIMLTAQQIGQPMTKDEILVNLELIERSVTDLRTWIEKGGYKPELVVWIEEG